MLCTNKLGKSIKVIPRKEHEPQDNARFFQNLKIII
jgi:hypothetical protein